MSLSEGVSADLLNRQQADIDLARAALEDNVLAMAKAGATAEQIRSDASLAYIAQSSAIFGQKLEEWMEAYRTVKAKVDALHVALTEADRTQNAGEMDAQTYSSAWSPSGESYFDAGDNAYLALRGGGA
ncbi:hypothetical protein [Streptomyces sp. NPDC056796]|uniref:hypothetical protein n=1 Tax=unclassified Streptomyces TaxID=2593676 RepID=UPI0036B78975